MMKATGSTRWKEMKQKEKTMHRFEFELELWDDISNQSRSATVEVEADSLNEAWGNVVCTAIDNGNVEEFEDIKSIRCVDV
jgi:hypothetical protein